MHDPITARPSDQQSPELSVAIMAYNEGANLGPVVEEMARELERLRVDHEIVIIDDGSTDETREVARSWSERDNRIRVITHPRNAGLGAVYRTAFRHCRGRALTFFPADGQFSAGILEGYLEKIARADMVLGYTPVKRRDALSVLLSKAERVLFRLLLGTLPDFQGIVMFRRELLRDIDLSSTGRAQVIMLELILKAHRMGRTIARHPVAILPRTQGRSKVNTLRNVWANAVELMRLRGCMKGAVPKRREGKG